MKALPQSQIIPFSLMLVGAYYVSSENIITTIENDITHNHHHHNLSQEVTIYTESNFWGELRMEF